MKEKEKTKKIELQASISSSMSSLEKPCRELVLEFLMSFLFLWKLFPPPFFPILCALFSSPAKPYKNPLNTPPKAQSLLTAEAEEHERINNRKKKKKRIKTS